MAEEITVEWGLLITECRPSRPDDRVGKVIRCSRESAERGPEFWRGFKTVKRTVRKAGSWQEVADA